MTFLSRFKRGVADVNEPIGGSTALHIAVQYASDLKPSIDHKVVKMLLKRGANRDIKNEFGLTPSQSALYYGKLQVVEAFLKQEDELPNIDEVDGRIRLQHLVKCLLKERNDCTVTDTNYSILLHFIVFQGDEELFEYVVKNSIFDVNALNFDGTTLLHLVAENGTPKLIKALMDAGADPEVFDIHQRISSIDGAISKGNTENLEFLLNCGMSPNKIQNHRNAPQSPLESAVGYQSFECVKILVQNGADVNEIIDGLSILQLACIDSSLEIVQFLVAHGADIHWKNAFNKTVLDESCECKKLEVVKFLLSLNAPLNQGHLSTLHYAVIGGNASIVRLLLEHGADVNLRCEPDEVCDNTSRLPTTAFELAVMYAVDYSEYRDIIEIMIKYEPNVNLVNPVSGDTPLYLARFSDRRQWNEALMKRLLSCNANVNFLNSKGLTLLHHALDNFTDQELKVLVAFIAKKIARKECVIEANLNLLKEKQCILPIYEKCVDEINRMRKNICQVLNFSFLNILTKDIDVLCGAMKYIGLLRVLDKGQYKKEFPIYASDLEERISRAKLRFPVVELATKLFDEHVKMNFQDEFIIICKYLSTEDLNNFLKACNAQVCEK